MAKNNRYKSGGNKRLALRSGSRKSKSYYLPNVYIGRQTLGAKTVKSINTLINASPHARRSKEILKAWKKVVARMNKLIAEGYDFDTPEFRGIYMGENIKVSKKQLERLKQLDMTKLRKEATSYKGITDKATMWKTWRQERKEYNERKKREKEPIPPPDIPQEPEDDFPDDIGDEIEEKIERIIDDEIAYIADCEAWTGWVSEERRRNCIELANEVIININVLDRDTKLAIIEFYESDTIGEMIEKSITLYEGYFYNVPKYINMPLLYNFINVASVKDYFPKNVTLSPTSAADDFPEEYDI